jgi:hypothetical protein
MWDIVAEVWAGFSLAKLAYSVILVAIIWLLASELLRVWWDPQLYVAAPTYFDDGKSDAAKGTTFGGQILAQHHRLGDELNSERKRRAREAVEGPAEVLRRWPVITDTLSLPQGLKQLELKIQGFDIGGMLTKLRTWISPVNEVAVTVEARSVPPSGKLVETTVSWPRAPQWDPNQIATLRYFSTAPLPGDEVAAAAIAASLLWGDIATQDPELRKVPHEEFAAWARSWQRYRFVRDRGATPGKLEKSDTDLLEEAGRRLKPILDRKPVYPEVWRLAANILALHPASIPDNKLTWDQYRDLYLVAVGVAPALPTVAAVPAALVAGGTGPGSLVWSEDGQLAVKVTAVVKDAEGKRFLLLPGLIARDDKVPVDLYDSSVAKDRQPVARLTRRIAANGAAPVKQGSESTIALAELPPTSTASNGPIRALGPGPSLGDDVRVLGTEKVGKVDGVAVDLTGLGSNFVTVRPRITAGGDAGAPIVDVNGNLIAMGYAGTQQASFLLPVPAALKHANLTLLE